VKIVFKMLDLTYCVTKMQLISLFPFIVRKCIFALLISTACGIEAVKDNEAKQLQIKEVNKKKIIKII